MTDEERERTMEFILNQQANFFSDIVGLKESTSDLKESVAGLRESVAGLGESIGELRDTQAQTQKQLDHITQLVSIFGEKAFEHEKIIELLGERAVQHRDSIDSLNENMRNFVAVTNENINHLAVSTNENINHLAATMSTLVEMFAKHAADPNAHKVGNDNGTA